MNYLLLRVGVDPRRFWLLNDLFHTLSDRREYMTQLGRDGIRLKSAAIAYAVLSGLFALLLSALGVSVQTYFQLMMGMTVLLLFCVLFSETSNSLVNPVEGIILAHQPIDGATYIAAKLTHLLRIVTYLAAGSGLPGALGGLLLKGASWYYPVLHLAAAFAAGLLTALFSCAFFGWLMRFVPATRLKSAGQTAELLPWLMLMFAGQAKRVLSKVHVPAWLPVPVIPRGYWIAALLTLAAAVVVFGIRSLSADYLVRVSAIVHGGAARKKTARSRGPASLVERMYGPAGRAGFEYLARMLWRDWQVRRQLLPLAPMILSLGGLVVRGVKVSPFSGTFTTAHLLPHVFGLMLFFVCNLLRFGSYPKAGWIFLLAPVRILARFARGLHAYLWLSLVLLPNLVILAVFTWFWGFWQAWIFAGFSIAVASCYLAMELRLIECVPFSQPAVPPNNIMIFGLMLLGGIIIAVAVALQYFVLFRSPAAAAAATLLLGGIAVPVTRSSLNSFESSMRYNLGIESEESGRLYTEIV